MINAITGQENSLYYRLRQDIQEAREMKFIVSFLMESGVKLIIDDLKKAIDNGTSLKIITGTYLNITEPSAIYYLKDKFGDKVEVRFFNKAGVSFHPKTYIIHKDKESLLYIGSSNISKAALTHGVEWNYGLVKSLSPADFNRFEEEFDYIYKNQSDLVTDERLKEYASIWKRPKISKKMDKEIAEERPGKIEPRRAQIEALYELKKAR